MSDFGSCFGFRVKGEHLASSEGGYRTPAGSSLRQGTFVMVDDASPGYLKAADANSVGEHRRVGLLLQYLGWNQSVYEMDENDLDTLGKGVCRGDRQSVIYYGPGVKFWVKNRTGSTRADGRVISAVTSVTLAGLAVGDFLEWDGTKWQESTNASHNAARVTAVSSDGVEAVLL